MFIASVLLAAVAAWIFSSLSSAITIVFTSLLARYILRPRHPAIVDERGLSAQEVTRRTFTSERATEAVKGRDPDVVVIGGGIGGMTAAAMLARNGYKVIALEQHDRLGGATHTFELSRKADGLPEKVWEASTSEEAKTAGEAASGEFVPCEFDSGYHYTCQAFADPVSRPGGFLRYAAGPVAFNDLGDPYDRVMFPHTERCSNNVIGATEYQFIRGSSSKLAKKLVEQLLEGPECKTLTSAEATSIAAVLETRFVSFFSLAHTSAAFAVRVFLVRALSFPAWLVGLSNKLDKWAVDGLRRSGELTTAYVIKAILGCGYSKSEVLKSKSLPDHVKPRVDGVTHALPLPASLSGLSPNGVAIYKTLLARAMALAIHPVGDYAAQPEESSFLAHSFVVNYYRKGSSYPANQSQDISEGMARTVMRNGGDCFVSAHVARIVRDPNSGRATAVLVRRAGSISGPQTTIRARIAIVNAAGIFNLYRPDGLLQDTALSKKFYDSAPFRPSLSHFYVFVTLKGSPSKLGLEATNMWCFEGNTASDSDGSNSPGEFDANNDMDGAFDAFLKMEGVSGKPPTVYITFPCAKAAESWDKRYPDVSNCIIFCDAKYEWFVDEETHDPRTGAPVRLPDYNARKEALRDALLKVLLQKRPDLAKNVVWVATGSPATSFDYLGAYRGADYGTRIDCDYFSKDGLKWLMRPDTPVAGLYQAGQDAMTPSISGAMHGGVLCAFRIGGMTTMLSVLWGMAIEQVRSQKGISRVEAIKLVWRAWTEVEF